MSVVEINGKASGTKRLIPVSDSDLSENLLDWLRSKDVLIASSCGGEGVCKKCNIQNEWLTCQMTLEEFFKRQPDGKVFVDYL